MKVAEINLRSKCKVVCVALCVSCLGSVKTFRYMAYHGATSETFAAAVPCRGADTDEDATASLGTPLWNFHGEADKNGVLARAHGIAAKSSRAADLH